MIKIESINTPSEGFFWIVDGEVVGISSEVPKYNYEYHLDGKTHENTWSRISNEKVSYDYYPRGRVMVDPEYSGEGEFIKYSVVVFLDPCIVDKKYKDKIIDYYNLDLKSCEITWIDMSRKTGIRHYTCHNCRN